jgi:hypothetical protein
MAFFQDRWPSKPSPCIVYRIEFEISLCPQAKDSSNSEWIEKPGELLQCVFGKFSTARDIFFYQQRFAIAPASSCPQSYGNLGQVFITYRSCYRLSTLLYSRVYLRTALENWRYLHGSSVRFVRAGWKSRVDCLRHQRSARREWNDTGCHCERKTIRFSTGAKFQFIADSVVS